MLVVDIAIRMEDNLPRRRPRSASCVALRQALSQLTRLSDFKTEKIGGGFFADVYKVEHTNTGEVMVLKMNKHRKNSRQMLCEIQLLNRLSHPNILGFRGSCVHEGQLHALTEYINGGTLEELLQHHDVELSWCMKTKIAKDIAEGMNYLHSRGIFHRDLTSRNCLIQHEPNGTLKAVVADFGLAAKIKDARGHSHHTEVVGTPYWMAPECLNGKEYCEKADVFSYGIILAETLAQIPADPDIMPRTKQYGMDYEKLKKLCAGCPEGLWDVMYRCSQIDPNVRPTFVAVVLCLVTVCPDDDIRSCQSEPAIMRDLEDSCCSSVGTTDLVQDIQTSSPTSSSPSHRWSAGSLSGQGPADIVHPPRVAPEVTMSDEAADDLQCRRVQDIRRGATGVGVVVGSTGATQRHQVPLESKEHVGSGDCTPVAHLSPPMECRRFGGRMLRSGCATCGVGLPLARVQTAPELTKPCGRAHLSCCVEKTASETLTDGELTSLPCDGSATALMCESSPLSSPEHAPCSPWIPFNTVDTPTRVLTSPLPPKNFRFSLELSTERHRPLGEAKSPLHSVNERLGSVSSDYGSGSCSQNGTPMFHDNMRSCSVPSIKLPRGQSTNYSLPLGSWSSDSSRSSISSSKFYDVRLRKNSTFSSTPNLLSTSFQTST